MLDKQFANEILSIATSTGADFAEIFFENSDNSVISLINGKVETALSGLDIGIGIRLFNKNKTIYAYTNGFDKDKIRNMAKEISKSVKNNQKITILDFTEKDYKIIGKQQVKILPTCGDKTKIVDILREASSISMAYNSSITETMGDYTHTVQDVLIANTKGLFVKDQRVRTRIFVTSVASNSHEKQTAKKSLGDFLGFEMYDNLDISTMAKNVSNSAVTMLNADYSPSGKMPVIVENGFGGVIFHEACGHSLEAINIARDDSVFCGKLGKKIASDKVTLIDDGTLLNKWGSLNIDDEGEPTQRTVLIENGILKNYLVDNFYGKQIGLKSTGSCRRQSYKFVPVPRMRNTFIANGKDKREDIISSTEKGIYAKNMGGGSVNPSTGDFNFAVLEAYMIENGKITKPIRGASLIGKGQDIIANIDMVSDNLCHETGMCGASSGSIPTCIGQPTLRVSEITVGGRV